MEDALSLYFRRHFLYFDDEIPVIMTNNFVIAKYVCENLFWMFQLYKLE